MTIAFLSSQRKIADGRLKRAEEDAGIIEQRAAETSVELIRAGNQLINLEIKEKALMQKQDHIDKVSGSLFYSTLFFFQLEPVLNDGRLFSSTVTHLLFCHIQG